MELFDAFSAKHSQVVAAVEVLHTLTVVVAQLLFKSLFVLIVEFEVGLGKYRVLFDYLVEDVNVQWETLSAFELLNELAANWASHSVLVVELLDTVRAKSVPTVNKNARNTLAHIILEPTELTDIKSTGLVI